MTIVKKLILIASLIILLVYLVKSDWVARKNPELFPSPSSESDEMVEQELSMSFADLTIPYLRNRDYSSNLGELTPYESAGNFDTYLTNYDSDGLKVNGLLTKPIGAKPKDGWPAIVFVHGYIAPSVYKTTEKYVDYVNYLAKNGFVVFKIDLRGHGESEGEPGGSYYSSDYIIDTLNARAALKQTDFVNPKAIGLWGHSMAGNVTFRAFVTAKDIPALVTWGGAGYTYEDLRTYGLNDNSYRPPSTSNERQRRRSELRELYGEYDSSSGFWQQVSPINYLEGVEGAIEIHHAKDDSVVNIGYARDLMKQLDGSKIPHTLYEYSSGGHNLSGTSFSIAMQRTVEFYKKHLIGN